MSDNEEEDSSDSNPDNKKYCKNCGDTIDTDAEICPACGVRQHGKSEEQNINVSVNNSNKNVQTQNSQDSMTSNKSKLLAALLAIFLGGIGLHKFYLGQPGRGILFLLFFWTGIPLIIGLIQGLSYLLMSEQKFAQKFG